ncbi:AraC family transcriptional regulator [Marinilongibacter aquaticus]|uniref:AraC family transcriptional regulator n=1 Tax=Marinilongibacter aquaticus TaxID=2975157 RepID=UPI0021BD3690|nr:helix-turn-helix domain-containing protein [Marinilongibacter aquaticus]UBM57539.1 AraC family transcriptional regulator [Marinilongibacter aquaticus]
MLRVPSEIADDHFESLKIQELTFVAYRSDVYPTKNEVYFEENAVLYVLEGEKKFVGTDKQVTVRKGDVFFVRRGYYLMSESIDESYRSLVFFIDEKLIKDFVNQNVELFPKDKLEGKEMPTLLILPTDERFGKFAESVLPYFRSKTAYLHHFLKLKLQELLLHLLSYDSGDFFKALLYQIFQGEKADLEYLMQNYYLKPLTIQELARLSGRSLSAFKRDFHEHFGAPPAKWIKEKRLERAAFLLKNSSKHVNEIAEEVAYESVSHFIKAFKSKFGVTPAQF